MKKIGEIFFLTKKPLKGIQEAYAMMGIFFYRWCSLGKPTNAMKMQANAMQMAIGDLKDWSDIPQSGLDVALPSVAKEFNLYDGTLLEWCNAPFPYDSIQEIARLADIGIGCMRNGIGWPYELQSLMDWMVYEGCIGQDALRREVSYLILEADRKYIQRAISPNSKIQVLINELYKLKTLK